MRIVQLLASIAMAVILTFYPFLVIHQGKAQHGIAMFYMLIMSLGLIGGSGITVSQPIAKWAISPFVFWLGVVAIFAYNFFI